VTQKTERASYPAPSVTRSLVPLSVEPPLNCKPEAEEKPLPKLIAEDAPMV
jgi:hypothetical protein